MALVTTFLTTPLTTLLYPRWYQVKVDRWRRGEIDWDENPVQRDGRNDSVAIAKDQLKTVPVRKLLVYLRLDGLSGVCTLAALLSSKRRASVASPIHPTKMPRQIEQNVEEPITSEGDEQATLKVHGVRLMELTDRDSSVMKVAAAGEHALWDPVVNTFRAFGDWHDLSLMAGVSVVPEHSYADTVIGMAQQDTADLLLLPWSETGTLADHDSGLEIDDASRFFDGAYTSFVSDILERVSGHVGILIEYSPVSASSKRPVLSRTPSGMSLQGSMFARQPNRSHSHHVVLPFFGGEDDRFALRFIMQLAKNDQVTATIIQITGMSSDVHKTEVSTVVSPSSSSSANPASSSQSDLVFLETLRDSVPEELQDRVVFHQPAINETITDPVRMAVVSVREELSHTSNKANNVVIVGRRSASTKIDLSLSEDGIGNDTRRTLGAVGTAMVLPENKIYGSVLVLQAGTNSGLSDYYR
jgi:hypothetical protein